jgi:hypothetical protein
MKSSGLTFVLGTFLISGLVCGRSAAQSSANTKTNEGKQAAVVAPTPPTGDSEQAKPRVPIVVPLAVGTAFNATLLTDLDARRNRAGDPFTAEITEPVKYQRSVILPKGTLLTGHLVRASAAGHGKRGSGLFLQFEKAQLKTGEEAVLNCGIQAISVAAVEANEGALPEGADSAQNPDAVEDVSNAHENEPAHEKSAHVLETSRTSLTKPKNEMPDPLKMDTPALTQGSFTKQGLFTTDSEGVFGMPDVKLYTPLSQGSNGTVLLSTRKDLRLPTGTKLLLVIQPPATAPATTLAPSSDSTHPN